MRAYGFNFEELLIKPYILLNLIFKELFECLLELLLNRHMTLKQMQFKHVLNIPNFRK